MIDFEEMDTMCADPVEETWVSSGSEGVGVGVLEDEYTRIWLRVGVVQIRCEGMRVQGLDGANGMAFFLMDLVEKTGSISSKSAISQRKKYIIISQHPL